MNFVKQINEMIKKLDRAALWIVGLIVVAISFVPYILMGEGSVFSAHDQLDETICAYLLNARHMFENSDVLPEMMGGIPKSGLQPSAVLFIPLYRILPLFTAFLLQYFIVMISAFWGMYGLLKRITGSSGIALVVGLLFSFLPFKPIYGLSVVGVPLLCLCFVNLYERKRIVLSIVGIVYFGLTTHLVLIGYVVLTYLGSFLLCLFWKKRRDMRSVLPFVCGFGVLLAVYCAVNYKMFIQLVFGAVDFISHRVEFINNTEGINIWNNMKNLFFYGESEYAPSYHWNILPVLLLITVIQGLRYKSLTDNGKKLWRFLIVCWILIIANAVLYGLLTSAAVKTWQNDQQGILRYFQADRYYWACPAIWWIMIGVGCALVWKEFGKAWEVIRVVTLIIMILPTMYLLKDACNLYDNLNEYNHGSAYTGIPTWQEYYMQDVLREVDAYIDRNKSEYRVAHVGFNPTPSLVYGFYTVDGYSNNYSLKYKQEFRKVIEAELEKSEYLKVYYDTWGSRCYLFPAEGSLQRKETEFVYQNLEFNMEALKKLGCEYIFSSGEIADTEGIALERTFETQESIYRVWLYRIL